MKVFVTGDLGHLGKRICALLLLSGHSIGRYDVRRNARENIQNTELLLGRLHGYDCVVHTAAIPHPNPSRGFLPFYQTNVAGTLSVLQASTAAGVRRMVFLSSVGYYGVNIRGYLYPAYFPIDEAHPIASMDGQSIGALDEYNQSRVIAEQLVAYYGTNGLLETLALRIGPANSKATQYPAGFDWRTDETFRHKCFFANCDPDYAARAVVLAVEYEHPPWYEAFNIVDRYTQADIDVVEFLERDYPSVRIRRKLDGHSCLFSTEKAQAILGFEPCEDLR